MEYSPWPPVLKAGSCSPLVGSLQHRALAPSVCAGFLHPSNCPSQYDRQGTRHGVKTLNKWINKYTIWILHHETYMQIAYVRRMYTKISKVHLLEAFWRAFLTYLSNKHLSCSISCLPGKTRFETASAAGWCSRRDARRLGRRSRSTGTYSTLSRRVLSSVYLTQKKSIRCNSLWEKKKKTAKGEKVKQSSHLPHIGVTG